MRALRAIILVGFIASTAHAQNGGASSSPWVRDSLHSSKLNEERTLFIATPSNYGTSKQSYPVLVLLDADDQPQFAAAVANVAFLANRGAIPDMLIVGVVNGKDRSHDMTPPATGATAKTFPTAGGAKTFADFIIDEVLPRVRSKYRTLPSTVLAGHSFGGLFALDVAATRPNAFSGIVAMSPSLWWNDSIPARDYATAIAKAPTTTRLFATSGGLEPPIAVTTKRFVSRLDSIKPATLAFASNYYPQNTHGLTPEPSLVDGIRFVYEPVSLAHSPMQQLGPNSDSATIVKALSETEDAYGRGARSLGLPDRFPEMQMNSWGYGLLQFFKMPKVAVWVFRKNVANYPDSPNAYDSLGDGLLAEGDSAGARAQFRMARDVAVRVGEPASKETLKKLDALEHAAAVQAGKAKP
jgi:predicted alpha/beta superfamily hydrolase